VPTAVDAVATNGTAYGADLALEPAVKRGTNGNHLLFEQRGGVRALGA